MIDMTTAQNRTLSEMNELLAIILIVIGCCLLFFIWLFSMAACPDTLVNFLAGRAEASYTSHESKELIARCEEANISHEYFKSVAKDRKLKKAERLSKQDKKLSVVPEADETQSTIHSTVHSTRASTTKTTRIPIQAVFERDETEADQQPTCSQPKNNEDEITVEICP